jgi:mono/diheme cytochrome c family protein
VGPNLDESSIDEAGAAQQVAQGGGGMPPFSDQLSEEQIRDVAAFVVASQG